MTITHIIPARHKELGAGFVVTQETFLTLEQFKALVEQMSDDEKKSQEAMKDDTKPN